MRNQFAAFSDARVPTLAGSAVCIQSVRTDPKNVAQVLEDQIDWLKLQPRQGEVWVVKLNLTYPEYLPGVVNSPIFVEGFCIWANEYGVKLNFVEGDGGNGAYSVQDTFDGNQVSEIARRYGMKTTSLSEKPWEWRETTVAGRAVKFPYSPFFRRREYDRFITTPLFKNHIFTIVSLGMKNLWGCIPDAYRMYYHYVLDHGIVALCKELRPDFSIFDGLVALRGRGPMDGKPVDMQAIMTCQTVGAGEAAALQVMGIPLNQVRHLAIAHDESLVPDADRLQWRESPTAFARSDFQVERSLLNYGSIWLGKLPRLQRLIYHSALSDTIYAIVDRLRPHSVQVKLGQARRNRRYQTIPFEKH